MTHANHSYEPVPAQPDPPVIDNTWEHQIRKDLLPKILSILIEDPNEETQEILKEA